MKYILVWMVATITQSGPVMQDIKDASPPMAASVCKDFGDSHKSRMEDWVRGALQSHWDLPVHVEYRCDPDSKPA